MGYNFVAFIGLHSSGSSAIAAVARHLGVYFGRSLGGYYGYDPVARGCEDSCLANLCDRAMPFPTTAIRDHEMFQRELEAWIAQTVSDSQQEGMVAACKYPLLCQAGGLLSSICGDGLRVVHCSRPLDESIISLQRRIIIQKWPYSSETVARHQRWLWAGKARLLSGVPADRLLTVEYGHLMAAPGREAKRIAGFLGLTPTDEQYRAAASAVKADARHVFGRKKAHQRAEGGSRDRRKKALAGRSR